MDLFVYRSPDTFHDGYPIVGYVSARWVERYQDPGEFEIVAPLSSGLRTLLPIGSIIGKVQSLELMIVENLEIQEDVDEEPMVIITGRTFVTFLEQRVSGFNFSVFGGGEETHVTYTVQTGAYEYGIDLVGRLQSYIQKVVESSLDEGNNLSNFSVTKSTPLMEDVSGSLNTYFKPDNVMKVTMELIKSWDIGIRTIRRNHSFGRESSESGTNTDIDFFVGEDKRATIKFSPQTGDIEAANYLWTIKNLKNSVFVKGKWISVLYHSGPQGLLRRMVEIDGSDIDEHNEVTPVPLNSAPVIEMTNYMVQRAKDYIARSKQIQLVNTTISKNNKYRYRTDYDIGDIVMLDTTYGEAIPMRVIEFAEVEDELGETGYPTLTMLDE